MAEASILLILAALYDLHGTEAVLRQHLPRPVQMHDRTLRDKTVGFIGFGHITRAVAERLAGWHVTIQAYTRRVRNDAPSHVHVVALEALLRTSNVVCVLVALNSDSQGLLNAERLRLLKQDAVLVNTARGAIIDEAALYAIPSQLTPSIPRNCARRVSAGAPAPIHRARGSAPRLESGEPGLLVNAHGGEARLVVLWAFGRPSPLKRRNTYGYCQNRSG
jgi:hypothetical protein